MLFRLGFATIALTSLIAAAGAWSADSTERLATATQSSTVTQTPEQPSNRVTNRKAVERAAPVAGKATEHTRVRVPRPTSFKNFPRVSGSQAAQDFLPDSWWPRPLVTDRNDLGIQAEPPSAAKADPQPPVGNAVRPVPVPKPHPPAARPGEQRLAHPRDIIAGHVPRQQPAVDDSEGTADPVGKTLSGATPQEPAGRREADPEQPPTNDDTTDSVSGTKATEVIEPEDEAHDELEPLEQVPPLTPRQIKLRDDLRRVRKIYQKKLLNTRDHGNWETMHAIVAYGVDAEIRVGSPYGRKVNAIGWICWNGRCARESLFRPQGNSFTPRNGPGLQGHDGQFLAMLAQARVQESYPLRIGGRDFTVADLIAYEQRTCEPNTELTFKLIGLNRFLEPDATWTDLRGREWSLERLVEEELKQPVVGAACGGTHRLFGLTYAYKRRESKGLPITGQFRRAKIFIDDYQKYAWKLQNRDGSFSTNWFAGRGNKSDLDRKMQTSGHISEWLAFTTEPAQLEDERMIRAMEFVARTLERNQSRDWRIGPLGHALNSLRIYDDRVYRQREKVAASGLTSTIPAAERPAETASDEYSPNRYQHAIQAGRAMAELKAAGELGALPASEAEETRTPVRTAEQPTYDGPDLIGPK